MAPALVCLDFLFYKIVSCSWGTCCFQYLDFSFQLEQWNFIPGQMVHGQLSTYAHIKVNVKSKKNKFQLFHNLAEAFFFLWQGKEDNSLSFLLEGDFSTLYGVWQNFMLVLYNLPLLLLSESVNFWYRQNKTKIRVIRLILLPCLFRCLYNQFASGK